MTQYYFVGTSLPELKIGEEPEISFEAFDELLRLNLTPSDYEKTKSLRLLFDLENLALFLQGKPLSLYGGLQSVDFEEALLEGGHFPEWIEQFLQDFQSNQERLQAFPKLWAYFASEYIPKTKGFLRSYFEFDRKLRLIFSALRAKKLKRNLAQEWIYEDPQDPLVQELLNGIPPDASDLVQLFQNNGEDPEKLREALLKIRFEKIEMERGLDEFSIDRLLAYMIQLHLVEVAQKDNL